MEATGVVPGAGEDELLEKDKHIELRVRVERAKLEQVLTDPKFTTDGKHIFEQIASRHSITSVSQDRNFKVGARAKKDPTVWIVGPKGCEVSLMAAKHDLDLLFDTKVNRICLKVEVPNEHHYAIIGRKGENQRAIMSVTGCHIHFPDVNKGRHAQKNQVSITGSPDGAEVARLRVRGLLPLTISFDVPSTVPQEEVCATPEIRAISEEYNVTIFFKRREPRGPLALVKGTRDRARIVEQAALVLLRHWTPNAEMPEYTLQVDIPTTVHGNIIGRGGANVQAIMASTNTTIRFPKANRESAVFISGEKSAVKTVHMYLQGLLTVFLVFELTDAPANVLFQTAAAQRSTVEDVLKSIETQAKIMLIIAKVKLDTITITLKGTEATMNQLYIARQMILLMCGVQGDFGMSNINVSRNDADMLSDDPEFAPPSDYALKTMQKLQSEIGSTTDHLWATNNGADNSANLSTTSSFDTATSTSLNGHVSSPKPLVTIPAPVASTSPQISAAAAATTSGQPISLSSSQHMQGIATLLDPPPQANTPEPIPTPPVEYHSPGVGALYDNVSDTNSPCASPSGRRKIASPEDKRRLAETILKNADYSQARTPTSYWVGGGLSLSMPEAELKKQLKPPKILGMDTLVESQSVDLRSRRETSPNPISAPSSPLRKSPSSSLSKISAPSPTGSTSTITSPSRLSDLGSKVEGPPDEAVVNYWSGIQTTSELLNKLDLPQYIPQFTEQEVDLATFLTLSDDDLREIGVNTLGARRKLALAIKELQSMRSSTQNQFLSDYMALKEGSTIVPPEQ
eukprot:m.166331 g.166331  ORF g.166331 m.166331 type:complete len:799 (+) comp15276_c0_seq3:279-2675(+)